MKKKTVPELNTDGFHLHATGGTIDSALDGVHDEPVPLPHSAIPSILKQVKYQTPYSFTEICMKDSRQLSKKDLSCIIESLRKSKERLNIVTIGTYMASDTARVVKSRMTGVAQKKVIIFVASYRPIVGVSPSDGTFNLGFAIGAGQYAKPGIYVAMHGQLFPADDVRKDLAEARFTSIFAK